MNLRNSGLIREARTKNGLRWSVTNGMRRLEVNASHPKTPDDLLAKRATAVNQLEELMAANGMGIEDLQPQEDVRGVNLR